MPNRHQSWTTLVLLGLAALLLSSCQLLSGIVSGNDGTTVTPAGDTRSLSDVVIDDFIASIQGNTFSRALDSAGKLNASDVATLKATIRNKVASDGLGASKNIDKILPSVMEGISVGVKNLAAVDSDTVVSAQLLSKAMKSTTESLSKNAASLSAPSVVLSDVLKVVVKKGAADLAVIAATDPESAGKALQAAVKEVSTALKSNSAAISETVVLQTVVTASVQAAVESNHTNLVQAIFTGTAQATTDATVVGDVVKEAVLKARDGQAGKLMDSDTATDLMKQASAGLTATTLTVKVTVDTALLTKTTDALKVTGVVVADAVVNEIKAVAQEADPVASLSATVDGSAYVENSELEYSTAARTVTLVLPTDATTTKQLIGPDGSDVPGTTYQLTGSGAFRFILLVKNTNGVKSAFKTLVIRIKSLPAESAPVAALAVTEGTTAVTGPLAWKAAGHALTFDTTGTTANTTIKILSDSPAAFPTKDAKGVWSVVQKDGTVNYTMVVRNNGGSKSAVETVTVTVSPEPSVVAALGAFNGAEKVTGALPNKAFYDLTLKSDGSTTGDVVYEVVATPAAQVIKTADGVWSTKIFTNTTFTLTVTNVGGQNSATATKTVTIAPEAAPLAVLAVKKADGSAATSLPFSETGYDLVLDPAGSTLTDTEVTLDDGGNNTVLEKTTNGTWTAKAVQKSTTFTLTVKNLGGLLSATKAVTVVIADPVANADVSPDVAAGREYVRQHNWSAAKTAFAGALLKNPADKDAKIWSAFLDLITLAVHPQVVDLMKNKVGVADYPGTMEALVDPLWMTSFSRLSKGGFYQPTKYVAGQEYLVRGDVNYSATGPGNSYISAYRVDNTPNSSWGWSGTSNTFVPSANGMYLLQTWTNNSTQASLLDTAAYAQAHIGDGTVYQASYYILTGAPISPLPRLASVPGFQRFDTNPDGTPAPETDFGAADYARLMLANVLSRNPVGFNSLVDQVVNGPFGTGFDSILARLSGLSDTERTEVPSSLLDQGLAYIHASSSGLPTVSLGKPELLLLVAQLKAVKSFVQYLGSVNFSYPIGQSFVDVVSATVHVDANNDGEDDLSQAVYQSTPGFYFTDFLKDRGNTLRTKSKETYLSALGDIGTAFQTYRDLLDDSSSYYRTTIAQLVTDKMATQTQVDNALPVAKQVLDNLIKQSTALKTAISTDSSLTVNPLAVSALGVTPLNYLTANLPDNGNSLVVNPAAPWSVNALDPRYWLESDANGFVLYLKNYTYNSTGGMSGLTGLIFDNGFFKAIPTDRSLLTPAFFNLASTVAAGPNYRDVEARTTLKVKKASLQAFYPAAEPNDDALAFSFGPSWRVVESNWVGSNGTNNYNYSYNYTYHLKPPVYVENYLAWVNKK